MSEKKKGVFITLEGTEGAGKSTSLNFIREYLLTERIPLTVTREPGGTPFAEELRQLLLAPRDECVCEDAELLLMFAARAQHIQGLICPALERGEWVLSDRFTDASFAYQGGGRGMSLDTISQLENLVQGELRPNLVILLDLPVDVGMRRVSKRGALDRFELENLAFFERVREVYLDRAKASPERYVVVNAAQSIAAVQEDIAVALSKLL